MGGKIVLSILLILGFLPLVSGAQVISEESPANNIIVRTYDDGCKHYEITDEYEIAIDKLGADTNSAVNGIFTDQLGSYIWYSNGKGHLVSKDCVELKNSILAQGSPEYQEIINKLSQVQNSKSDFNYDQIMEDKNLDKVPETPTIINKIKRWFKRALKLA